MQTQLLQELSRGTESSSETWNAARQLSDEALSSRCPAEGQGATCGVGALTCGADGEDHLYRVEEEEHD